MFEKANKVESVRQVNIIIKKIQKYSTIPSFGDLYTLQLETQSDASFASFGDFQG